jgi:hypothetical protein
MSRAKFIYLLISLLPGTLNLPAQEVNPFVRAEFTLQKLSSQMWKGNNDSIKLSSNAVFRDSLLSVLALPGAYENPFDSLKGISRLKPEDNLFRIMTWNIPLNNGTFRYYGVIQLKSGGLFIMEDRKIPGQNWIDKILDVENWYGAIYYSIITRRFKNENVYTLLGWEGNDASSNIKLIDIISFSASGKPQFGKPVFKTPEGLKSRVLIEYAENGNVLLRYDYQSLLIEKGKRIKEVKDNMIVMDHLIPMDPSLTGMRRFYVPSGDIYDAYIYQDGFWKFAENVKVANPPTFQKSKQDHQGNQNQ